ncbi:MAG TPA: hypothetical protein VHM22_00585 [Bradyrhizobium sp.]|nr:hypothetical protein [Bradyrhizobium sp.]
MPPLPDGEQRVASRSYLAIAALIAAGYALTLLIFYPGIMTFDAKFVYGYIAKGVLGDWQSPLMTLLWKLIDPIAPGSGSMFLLIATSYWLGFGLLAFAAARRSTRIALCLPLLALMPPAFVFVGIIWRDVLFAITWFLAAVIAYAAGRRGARLWLPAQSLGLALCAFGVLLRPNALVAAPILAAYILWPSRLSLKRAAILFVPAMLAFFALVQVVYYGVLGATRQHPLQTIMVFDLGGISHFTKQNQFPVTWSDSESAMLLNSCYQPTEWDIYWRLKPCDFVMRKIEKEQGLFGTAAITEAWMLALTRHPLAYLRHRSAFMWNFLAGDNPTMWLADLDHWTKTVFPDRVAFAALVSLHNLLKPTPLFRTGSWLLVCLIVCGFAWRRRWTPEGAFAFGVCGSAAVYVLSFFAVGVASDFRYGYWAVLAGIAGGTLATLGGSTPKVSVKSSCDHRKAS